MDFAEQKAQIIAQMKRGDKKAIAKKAGVSTVTLWSAVCKNDLNSMSDKEQVAWSAAIEFMNDRKNNQARIEQKTAKLTGRM